MSYNEKRAYKNPDVVFRGDLIELIEAMKDELPPIKLRNIAKKLNVTEDYVRRRIRKLGDYGLGFRTNFDLRKIGLSTLVVIFEEPLVLDAVTRIRGLDKNISYILRWHGNINLPKPMGIALFYIPYKMEVKEDLILMLKRSDIPRIVGAFEADISKYDNLDLKKGATISGVDKRWKSLTEQLNENALSEKSFLEKNNYYIDIQRHVDLIDLIILAKLQNDSLTSMSEIAKLLGVSVGKVNRHLRTHIISQNLIEGNSLKRKTQSLGEPSNIFLIIKGKAEQLYLLRETMEVLSKQWEFLSALYNSNTGEYLVLLLVKAGDMEKIDRYLHKLFGEILGTEYFIGIVNKSTIKSYTIPFISYNREERGWDLDQQLMDIMRQKFVEILAKGPGTH
jgi:DNA-binding Lrp family transcriptional regulator